jgi:adenylylsulfate kinase-like enzyme
VSEIESNKGFTLWFFGLSSSGKTTIANTVQTMLDVVHNIKTTRLHDDDFKKYVYKNLTFEPKDRFEKIRIKAYIAKLLNDAGVNVVVTSVTNHRAMRIFLRQFLDKIILCQVDTPLAEVIRRDTKGLYKKALYGEIHDVVGINYELHPAEGTEYIVPGTGQPPEQSAQQIINTLADIGFIKKQNLTFQDYMTFLQ